MPANAHRFHREFLQALLLQRSGEGRGRSGPSAGLPALNLGVPVFV